MRRSRSGVWRVTSGERQEARGERRGDQMLKSGNADMLEEIAAGGGGEGHEAREARGTRQEARDKAILTKGILIF